MTFIFLTPNNFSWDFNFLKFRKIHIFSWNSHPFEISKKIGISWILSWHFLFLWFNTSTLIFNIFWTRNLVTFLFDHDAKQVNSIWQSCGEPSTKFPHGGLVECLLIAHTSHLSISRTHVFFHFFSIFPKNLDFFRNFWKSGTLWIWRSHLLSYELSYPYSSSTHARQGFLGVFLKVTEQNLVNSIILGW